MKNGLTHEEIAVACRNVGVDLSCDACAAIFYTGSTLVEKHNCLREIRVEKEIRANAALLWFLQRFKLLSGRWPCPDCGRSDADAPLRLIHATTEDGRRYSTGCTRCCNEDLLAESEAALEESDVPLR